MLNIVLLGPPGAGKGTQSKKLLERYNLFHVAPGDLFREALKQRTPLGKEVQEYIEAGNLVPDELVIRLVTNYLDAHYKPEKGLLFDGYPRRVGQAFALDKQLANYGQLLHATFLLDVPEEEIKKRIQKRSIVEGRSDDQDSNKVATRIANYKADTLPVIDHYTAQSCTYKVSGVGEIDVIHMRLLEILRTIY